MIERLNTWIIYNYIQHSNASNEFDKERIRYSLTILLNEFEKTLAIFLFFIFCNQLKTFLIAFIILLSLRIFIGGFHFSKNFSCFLFSLIFFIMVVLSAKLLIIPKAVGVIVCIIAIVNISILTPLQAQHRTLLNKGKKFFLKIGALIVMFILVILFIFFTTNVSNIIIWTVIFQQIEIIYCTLLKRRGETK